MSKTTLVGWHRELAKITQFLDDKALSNCLEIWAMAEIQPENFICADQTVTHFCAKQVSLGYWEHWLKPKGELNSKSPTYIP